MNRGRWGQADGKGMMKICCSDILYPLFHLVYIYSFARTSTWYNGFDRKITELVTCSAAHEISENVYLSDAKSCNAAGTVGAGSPESETARLTSPRPYILR